MKIGIIKERKIPSDTRVPLTPKQCLQIVEQDSDTQLSIERSDIRCFKDEEYLEAGLMLVDSVEHCDILLGVKEVPMDQLIYGKTYFFFSHTTKGQPYNMPLLQQMLDRKIKMVDWEALTNNRAKRLIAFGRWAGIVGAHNGLMAYGKRSEKFDLKRLKDCFDFNEAVAQYKTIKFPPIKVLISGTGRVSHGAAEVLNHAGFQQLTAPDYIETTKIDQPVFCMISSKEMYKRSDGSFDKADFYANPRRYHSNILPYLTNTSLFINGIYWDEQIPAFFSLDDMNQQNFGVEVIADITCDIAPVASIPSTIRPSTIAEPVYGFNPRTGREQMAYLKDGIDIMAVDNLPNELPRDASTDFGNQFLENILPALIEDTDGIIQRATICADGKLNAPYQYLKAYLSY